VLRKTIGNIERNINGIVNTVLRALKMEKKELLLSFSAQKDMVRSRFLLGLLSWFLLVIKSWFYINFWNCGKTGDF